MIENAEAKTTALPPRSAPKSRPRPKFRLPVVTWLIVFQRIPSVPRFTKYAGAVNVFMTIATLIRQENKTKTLS